MKDIQKLDGEFPNYYDINYHEPLLEYVGILGDEYNPVTPMDYEDGYYVTKAIGTFSEKYFENEIDKSFEKRFIESKDVQDTITALGYDVEKFWYLLLFVNDYCNGMCINGIMPNKSPKESISQLVKGIISNVESYNKEANEVTFKSPTKIVLDIKGKHKISIDDPFTVFLLAEIGQNALDKIEDGSLMTQSITKINFRNGKVLGDTESNSVHIWYFATMFLKFFDLMPAQPIAKRGIISCNKRLLVSRLIYIVGLTKERRFYDKEDTLNSYFNQYKNYKVDMTNSTYW